MRSRALCFAILVVGCGGETINVGPPPTPPPPTTTVAATEEPAPEEPTEAAGPTAQTYADSDFVEADTNRDPFRAYTSLFVPHTPVADRAPQRTVILDHVAVEEMHLIAIVSGVASPTAMITGTDGTGYSVQRGDYVGRAEIVQTGGDDSVPVTLNWRVDRIRDDSIILTREDPTAPNRPPLTRELALHDPSEAAAGG